MEESTESMRKENNDNLGEIHCLETEITISPSYLGPVLVFLLLSYFFFLLKKKIHKACSFLIPFLSVSEKLQGSVKLNIEWKQKINQFITKKQSHQDPAHENLFNHWDGFSYVLIAVLQRDTPNNI